MWLHDTRTNTKDHPIFFCRFVSVVSLIVRAPDLSCPNKNHNDLLFSWLKFQKGIDRIDQFQLLSGLRRSIRLLVLVALENLNALNSKPSATLPDKKRERKRAPEMIREEKQNVVSVDPVLACWLDDRLLVRCLRAAEHARIHEWDASVLLPRVIALGIPGEPAVRVGVGIDIV